jgi:hypothetical protein
VSIGFGWRGQHASGADTGRAARRALAESFLPRLRELSRRTKDAAGGGPALAPRHDPSPLSLVEVGATARAGARIPGGIEMNGPPLREMVAVSITDHVSEQLAVRLRQRFGDELGPRLRNSISRSAVRSTTLEVTAGLTQSLTRTLFDLLSLSLTTLPTRRLVETMVPTLTFTLAPIIAHSLSRDPKADYYCHYCRVRGLYCGPCRASLRDERVLDHRVSHYADYYARYYARFYGGSLADSASQAYFERTRRTEMGRRSHDALVPGSSSIALPDRGEAHPSTP